MTAEHGIWMPIYWGEYFGKTSGLTCEEHGAYLLLIGAYWQRGHALPDDDKFLSTATRLTIKRWKIIRQKISEYFDLSGGSWRHERVEKELLRSCSRISSAHAKAHARWHPGDMLVTSTVTKEERKKVAAPPRFDEFWLVCPRKIGRAAAEKAWSVALKDAEAELMILAMRGFAGRCSETPEKYIPGPATWLTDKRWMDEDGGSMPLDPETAAEVQDRADRLMRRGKYAEKYQ